MNDLQRAIVTRVISDAVDAGYDLDVFNGEAVMIRHSRDEREIFSALQSAGEDELRYRRAGKRVGFVRLVYANDGWRVASEFSPALAPVMVGARHVAEGEPSRSAVAITGGGSEAAPVLPGRLARFWPTGGRSGRP